MKLSLIIVMLTLTFTEACKKSSGEKTTCNDAVIRNRGMVAADGCGWMVEINGKDYHPFMLDDKWQISDLNVHVCYTISSETYQCGFVANAEDGKHPVINISKIEKR